MNKSNSNDTFIKALVSFGALCLILMGITNLHYTKSVKLKEEMNKFESRVTDYNCKGLEKYGDRLSITMEGIDRKIFFTDVRVDCERIIILLKNNAYRVTVWVDIDVADFRGYSLKIGNDTFESSEIGKTYEQLNLVSVLMLMIGAGMLIQAFQKK